MQRALRLSLVTSRERVTFDINYLLLVWVMGEGVAVALEPHNA